MKESSCSRRSSKFMILV